MAETKGHDELMKSGPGWEPIETRYGGLVFRSRLEAKWAAMFDWLGLKWAYEPFDAKGYIPDFLLHGPRQTLVEVKPILREAQAYSVGGNVLPRLDGVFTGDIVVVGADPLRGPVGYYVHGLSKIGGITALDLMVCAVCKRNALFTPGGALRALPCGHYNDYVGARGYARPDVKAGWAHAHNQTRWNPAAPSVARPYADARMPDARSMRAWVETGR